MENLPAAIAKIVASDFCNGRGGKGWTADFDFLLQPNTVAKVMEGKYDNRRAGGTDRPGSANVSETIKPKMLN